MSITAKRILFSAGCLIVWLGISFSGNPLVITLMCGIAGWQIGGWIFELSRKVFPD